CLLTLSTLVEAGVRRGVSGQRRRGFDGSGAPTFAHSVALAFGRNDSGVLGEAIEQRRRQLFVAAEDPRPLGKREIGGDEPAAPAVPRREHIEQQLTTGAIKRDEPNLVEHDHVDALQTTQGATQLLLVASLD